MRVVTTGLGFVALTLSACQPQAEAAGPVAQADPRPSETMQQTFRDCQWGKVEGSGLAVWSYGCPAEFGNVRLVADDSLPGFAVESTYESQTARSPAIVIFKKAADAPVSSVVDQVRAKSPGPDTATCALEPASGEATAEGVYAFVPTGAAKVRWDAISGGDAMGDAPSVNPCGDYGPQMSGDRAFYQLEGDPTTVVFVEYGSEIQIFDPETLRPAG